MDPSSLPIFHFQHPNMTMKRSSEIGSVPGSIPLNFPTNNPAHRNVEVQGVPMSDNNASFTQKTAHQHYSQIPLRKEVDDEGRICAVVLPKTPLSTEEHASNYHNFISMEENKAAQLSTKEINPVQLPTEDSDDGLLEKTEKEDDISIEENNMAHHHLFSTEENDNGLLEVSQEEIKSEKKDDISSFMETAHDIFLKITSKELKIQEASELLGRPYSFVYSRYQEFCDNITGKNTSKEKMGAKLKGNGKKKRRTKKLSISKRHGKVFQCPDCPAIFHTAYLIKTHSKMHIDNNKSNLCTSCGIVFSKIGQLMRHRIDVHDDALQCPHCDKQYTKITSYKFHINSHKTDQDRPFVCEECGKGFFSRVSLEEHNLKHTGFKPFMCGHCEKTFKSIKVLASHQKVHTEEGNQPKICAYCGKSFKSVKALGSHLKVHTRTKQPKNFECKECGQRFKKNSKLEQHMRTHTGEKPHACDLCNARFNLKANLKRHKMIHTGENPFKCKYCSAAFLSKVDLQRHTMAHTGIKPYKCTLCDYSCVKKPSMEYHMNTHTGKTPFKCDFYGCSAEFASPSTFKQHKLKHFPPPLKTCKLCNENFPDSNSLKYHMLLHTGNKPLSCDQCEKIFYNQSSLNRHVHVHINKPLGNKPKQIRQRKRNSVVKSVDKSRTSQKVFTSEYEVPVATENVQSSLNQSWTIGAQGINSHQLIHSHFPPSQHTNLNAWPSTMGPDELRQRLLDSFK